MRRGARRNHRQVKSIQPLDDGPPFRQRAIDVDEEGQRILHAVEGGRGLHQPAELHLAGEVGRADNDIGKYHRSLRIACGEERQLLGAAS